jgi:nucleotide-binding universal stress UspA family protein
MTSHVLVPMNGSEMAEEALEFALETYADAEITVLNVVGAPTWHMGDAAGLALSDDLSEATETQTEELFEHARELAATHGIEIDTVADVGSPSRAIVRRAEDFDVVVVGSHGRGLSSRLLVGNFAATVARRSPVPVTVVG